MGQQPRSPRVTVGFVGHQRGLCWYHPILLPSSLHFVTSEIWRAPVFGDRLHSVLPLCSHSPVRMDLAKVSGLNSNAVGLCQWQRVWLAPESPVQVASTDTACKAAGGSRQLPVKAEHVLMREKIYSRAREAGTCICGHSCPVLPTSRGSARVVPSHVTEESLQGWDVCVSCMQGIFRYDNSCM